MSHPAVPDWNLFHPILQDKHRLAQTLNQWEARFLPLSTNEKLGSISYQPMTSWFELEDRRTEGQKDRRTDGRTYKPCTKPAFRQAIKIELWQFYLGCCLDTIPWVIALWTRERSKIFNEVNWVIIWVKLAIIREQISCNYTSQLSSIPTFRDILDILWKVEEDGP